MRVHDSNLQGITTGTQQSGQTTSTGPARGAGGASKAGGGDRVHLSSFSEQLKNAVLSDPNREARISELAAAYRNGSYQPDARAISRSLVDDAFGPR